MNLERTYTKNDWEWLRYYHSIKKWKLILIGLFLLLIGIVLEIFFETLKDSNVFFTVTKKVVPKIFYSVAVIILTDCIIHLLHNNYIRKLEQDELFELVNLRVKENICQSINTEIDAAFKKAESANKKRIDSLGITDAFIGIPWDIINAAIRNAKQEVCILKIWMHEENELFRALYDALVHNNIKVKIALLDQKNKEMQKVLKLRIAQLPKEQEDILQSMNLGQLRIHRLHENLPNKQKPNLEYYKYSLLPTLSLIKIDDEMFYSPYLFGALADENIQVQVTGSNRPLLYRKLKYHLDKYFVPPFRQEFTTKSNFKPDGSPDIEDDTDYGGSYDDQFDPN
ncbi:MAG TPA: hypothetical protein VGB46_09225 [Flavisolibacter sp.]|jgi:hypothetical protein